MQDTLTIQDLDALLKEAGNNYFMQKDEEGKTKLRKGIDKAKDLATGAVGLGASGVGAISSISPKFTSMKEI